MKTMKKSLSLTVLVMALFMAMAASVFAATQSYEFYYDGAYDSHSSSFIAGDASIDSGQVTITLTGDYFPELEVGSTIYYGSYDSGTNLTTFVFPGSTSADIPLSLHVVVGGFHNTWYDLTLVWT
ncbi:hypothetical protein [Paenibacillus sp. HB172176]|uniref:hypothetical protein n=1 Tax=Paenibacillus sp. HB172176 TaxID=2493690 RepID=UPI001439BDB3|nr:hypothetical protein [Paenibacillus sp. HB172176]